MPRKHPYSTQQPNFFFYLIFHMCFYRESNPQTAREIFHFPVQLPPQRTKKWKTEQQAGKQSNGNVISISNHGRLRRRPLRQTAACERNHGSLDLYCIVEYAECQRSATTTEKRTSNIWSDDRAKALLSGCGKGEEGQWRLGSNTFFERSQRRSIFKFQVLTNLCHKMKVRLIVDHRIFSS